MGDEEEEEEEKESEHKGGAVELDGVTTLLAEGNGEKARRKTTGGMLDFEQQTNQALASLDDDWHLLEGECTTFAIFPLFSLSSRPIASEGARKRR